MKKKGKRKVVHLKKRESGFEVECVGCELHFVTKDVSQRFCDEVCETFYHQNKKKNKKRLSRTLYEVKIDYPKLTFRLSVIGFVGSIAFYLGVIRDLHENSPIEKDQIVELEQENEDLKKTVDSLTVILEK